MADQLRFRGGDQTASDNFTGAEREVTVDTTEPNLRVHDGKTPGGHKVLMASDCLVVDKNPCKVTVNGELDVGGDVHIGGNVTIDGTIDLGDVVVDLESDDVTLRNPGDYTFGCNVPDANNQKTQADANSTFYDGIRILDEKLCIAQKEIQDLELQYQQLENRVDQNEIDIAELNKEIDNLKQETTDIENAIRLLEIEIENNANAILDHEGRISALEALVQTILDDIDDFKDWIKNHSIEDHTDVDLAAPSAGDYFVYKNGKWTNEAQCNMKCNTYIPSLATL